MTITLNLRDEQLATLKHKADAAGVTAEEYAVRLIERASEEDFKRAADYVLSKNAELYRRLAK